MKTNKILLSTYMLCAALSITFSSCKKPAEDATPLQKVTPITDEKSQASSDSRLVIAENDASISDINQKISENSSMQGGRLSTVNGVPVTICGLTVDTLGAYKGTIKLNYSSAAVCDVRKREGAVKLTIVDYAQGKRWKDAGTVLKVEYIGYKVTNIINNESVELNGVQNLKNISGGNWAELLLGNKSSLVNSVTGTNLSVKFNAKETATYNINRQFTYTWSLPVLTCTGEGIGEAGGLTKLENYGKTRNGDDFTSEVKAPVVWNSTCGANKAISGELNIKIPSKNFDLNCLFGVGPNGISLPQIPSSCTTYGWKLTWTVGNMSDSKVIPYY